jgi:hypothetical protein
MHWIKVGLCFLRGDGGHLTDIHAGLLPCPFYDLLHADLLVCDAFWKCGEILNTSY